MRQTFLFVEESLVTNTGTTEDEKQAAEVGVHRNDFATLPHRFMLLARERKTQGELVQVV